MNSDYLIFLFISNLKLRIRADFQRMGSKFWLIWGFKNILCKLEIIIFRFCFDIAIIVYNCIYNVLYILRSV